jgi:hypothetical protein
MADISRLSIGGAVVFWRLAKSTSLPAVAEGLTTLGLKNYVPEPRTAMSCLRAALGDAYQPEDKETKHVVRPHTNSVPGFAVVAERPKEHVAPGDDYGKVVAIAGLGEDASLVLKPYDVDRARMIEASMKRAGEWLTAASVGRSLTGIIAEHLSGVTLRPNGGVYWLSDWALDEWTRVADLFEAASAKTDGENQPVEPNKIYVLRVVADEQMVRAVGDALTSEVEAELAQIEAELAAGELKPGACLRRVERVGKIEAKVQRYANAFGVPMTKLTEATTAVAGHAAMAALQVSAAANPNPTAYMFN